MEKTNWFTGKAVAVLSACTIAATTVGYFNFNPAAAAALSAAEITEQMGLGINIGNSMDSIPSKSYTDILKYEQAWGNPVITQELVDAVKAKGLNTVRIPTTWFPHLDDDNNIDPAWMARVKEVVDYAYNQGMYVILNIHHEEWVNREDIGTAYEEMSPKLVKIWTQIANEFKDYDQHLIFEGMNEPRAAGTEYEWWANPEYADEFNASVETINKLDADFVKTVRSIDSPYKDTRLLMIPAYCASSDVTINSLLKIPAGDDYVAASVHAYAPYNFCMGDETKYSKDFTDSYKAELDGLFANIRSTFTDKDIPVVLGEFSASDFGNTEARCEWATYYMTWTKKLGIPCVIWDNNAVGNSDKAEIHTYVNRKTAEWYPNGEAVVDKMLDVINDSSIGFASESHNPNYVHQALSEGTKIAGATKNKTNVKVTGDQLSTGEVAIEFTGSGTPYFCLMDAEWGGWTEVKPYDVVDGVAYFDSENIKKQWGGDLSNVAYAQMNAVGDVSIQSIVGLKPATISTEPRVTTEPKETTTTEPIVTTTTKAIDPNDMLRHEMAIDQDYSYSDMPPTDRMIGFAYEDFGIEEDETVVKVEVNISSLFELGDWVGAFGTSAKYTVEDDPVGIISDDYWAMTDEMSESFGDETEATITWDVDADFQQVIQTQYGGEVKVGFWWIGGDYFVIDSVVIYTVKDGEPGSETVTTPGTTTIVGDGSILYGDVNLDDMIGLDDVVYLSKRIDSVEGKAALQADCFKDGILDVRDTQALMKYIAGVVKNLPMAG